MLCSAPGNTRAEAPLSHWRCQFCEFDAQRLSLDTAGPVIHAESRFTGRLLKQNPRRPSGVLLFVRPYRLVVLSRQVLFAAAQPVVVGATVMSPRAVIV